MFSNIIMNFIFIGPLAHAGLALATSLAAFINAGLLFYFLRKGQFYIAEDGWLVFTLRIVFASSIMSALLFFMSPDISLWTEWDLYTRVMQLGLWIIAGGSSYFAALWLTGLRLQSMTLDAD